MTRSALLVAAIAVAVCAAPALAATPTDARSAVLDGLDSFCKPYLAGADGAATNAAAQAAGWTRSLGMMKREGDWGRVTVDYKPGASCVVTVPAGGAKGAEVAILDAAGAWARKAGYSRTAARTTTASPKFDALAEDWTRPGGGNALGLRAYVNRSAPSLVPDVTIYIYAK